MTDGTAGWFRDPNDPSLARWHDGDRWTENTLVIADQAPGSEPAPPAASAPTMATPMFDADGGLGTTGYGYTEGPSDDGSSAADRVRGLPTWAKILAPLVVVAVIGAAFLLTSGDDGDKTETADTQSATLDDAVDAARRAGLTDEVSDARAAALIERICDAANNPSDVDELGQDLGSLPAATTSDLREAISALGVGAEARCKSDLDDAPDLIDDLQDEAIVAFSTTTTAVTLVPDGTGDTVPGGTDAGATTGGTSGSTTGGKTATTKKGATTTNAPTTTTTRPPTQALPNQPCSPEGAAGQNKITDASMTCSHPCSGGTKLVWRQGSCPTNPTAPTTTPGQTMPTAPTTAST